MNFLNGSFRVGRLFGINIHVHVLFLVWAGFLLFSAGEAWKDQAGFLTILFGIVLLHEFGHCFGARAVGGEAENIMMWPLGGLAFAQAPMRPWPQFVTIAAGPLVNVVLCALTAGLILYATGGGLLPGLNPLDLGVIPIGDGPTALPEWLPYAFTFYHVNLFLLAFNLLPVYPLDGGQLLHTILWPFLGLQRATLVACYLGLGGAVALGTWGLLGNEGMPGILVFIAIFGGFTCWQRLQMLRYGMIYEDTHIRPYGDTGRYARRTLWNRIFGAGLRRGQRFKVHPSPSRPPEPEPEPEDERAEQQRLESEVDRILKKVSERGLESLSYIERQTLEYATRRRQAATRNTE